MTIYVMGCEEAAIFFPLRPTLVMRILNPGVESLAAPLRNSLLFCIKEYCFEDVDKDTLTRNYPNFDLSRLAERQIFTPIIAQAILRDFSNEADNYKDHLFHCTQGISRSPAVAIALNELYLKNDEAAAMKKRFPKYNRYVYRLLCEQARQ